MQKLEHMSEKHLANMIKATDTILEHLLDAVLVVDHTGCIIYANPSAQTLFEQGQDELVGQPFGFPILAAQVQEIQLLRRGVLLTVQMLASHIQWEGKKASLLSLRDITTQKQNEEMLKEQKRLLEIKNEENAQFASLASHDLKEPVRKIIFFSDRLINNPGIAESDKEQATKILNSARKMSALISGIADLSKVNHMQQVFEPVNLKKIVEEVCEDLELQIAEKEAQIESEDLPVIEAMPGKMYQLFLNLISNSLKYSREEVPPRIRINCERVDEDWVRIVSSDNGIGFDNRHAEKLFQPFMRLHAREYDGIGVGLALCQKIIELHGGKIKATGEEGKGASFSMLLPLRHRPRSTAWMS